MPASSSSADRHAARRSSSEGPSENPRLPAWDEALPTRRTSSYLEYSLSVISELSLAKTS